MDEFSDVETAFQASIVRSRDLCSLNLYISDRYTPALDVSDLLRAGVVLSVSAFDYLAHELFRVEVLRRHAAGAQVERFPIPFNILTTNQRDRPRLIDQHVREVNSHRTFVDPGKFAEAMSCFVASPWALISKKINEDEKSAKVRMRAIYRWRNRISHEADINPSLGGIERWPIEATDVLDAIADIERTGLAAIEMIRESAWA